MLSLFQKLALKCIRALRTKKKHERGPLTCQICKNKSFTAQATLMYHYRSHAGKVHCIIKKICNLNPEFSSLHINSLCNLLSLPKIGHTVANSACQKVLL